MAWVAGDRLQGGKYTIERELGRGRFGITYLVKNKNGDRFVIKTLNDDLLNSLSQFERERLKTMFLREALKLQKCKHKYIVEVLDSFEEADCLCLVMEYVNEVSLADLRPPTLSEPDALRYIQQIGEALIVVHENELIHRDVHPGNILLRNREGQLEAVLIDFGLALDFDHILTTSRTKETSDGFTPPELYARGTITRAYSDIYSLAATLYKLLTGRTPVDAVKRKVDGEHLVSPKEWNPQISEGTNRAILKGMQLDAKQRPQSMREWLDLLGLTAETPQPVTTVSSNTNSNWDKKIQFWTVVIAAIAALGGLLAGVGAVMDKLKSPASNSPPSVSPSPSSSKTP
ncbi:MAG: serine/threonine protein kinase [Nostoc sp. SerVER01]|nr:serine/threonine-protein kinase [Nostoc sp. SerVER01]RCJ17910.1 serine/threonine protein kinase [Nostoc sp. ATCC 43529]